MAKKWNFRCRKEDFAVAMNGTLFFQNDDGVYTPVGYINDADITVEEEYVYIIFKGRIYTKAGYGTVKNIT